jgi:stage III sporulation protein AD
LNALEIGIVAVSGVVLLSVIKKSASVYTTIVQIALGLLVLISVLPEGKKLMDIMSSFNSIGDTSAQSIKIMIKSFGILSVGAVTADICRDNGENALAGVVEIGVKILAVSCALPVFEAVITLATSFFNR